MPYAVMEAALAHAVRNKVEAACTGSNLFEKRRTLMESGQASRAGRGSTTWTSCSRSSRWRTWKARRPSPPVRATICSRSGARHAGVGRLHIGVEADSRPGMGRWSTRVAFAGLRRCAARRGGTPATTPGGGVPHGRRRARAGAVARGVYGSVDRRRPDAPLARPDLMPERRSGPGGRMGRPLRRICPDAKFYAGPMDDSANHTVD